MEDIIDIIVTETTNLIEITSQPTDEIIDVNIIDNREDVTLNVTPTVVEININSLTGNFGVNWGEIDGTLSNQTDLQNALNLKADLVDGKVPSSQLPSYVDDVVEVANYAALPVTGEVGKIYITLDTNYIYRWTGSTYVEIKDSSAVWGAITGTLSNQTDLQNALNAKLNTSTAASTYVPYTGATGNVNLGLDYSITAALIIKSGGTSTQFLKADGSIDTNTYATTSQLHNAVTIGTANGLSLSTQVLSLGLASSSANGALSSTDWSTFNGKQAALSGTGFVKISGTTISYDNSTYLTTSAAASTYVSGSGTTNYLPRWSSSKVLTDSFIYTNGNFTEIQGQGLTASMGIVVSGRYGSVANAPKIYSSDETTGVAHIELVNGGGEIRLGVEKSTGGQILPGSSAYATVLTAGLSARNLEFGTNNTKRMTIDGSTGTVTLTGALSGTSATFSGGAISLVPTTFAIGSSSATDSNAATFQSADNNYLLRFKNSAGTSLGGFYYDGTNFIADQANWKFGSRVGINGGTNSSRALQVTQTSGLSSAIRILATTGTSGLLEFIGDGASSQPTIGVTSATPNNLTLSTGGNPSVTITSSGNVGIGTTSPSTLLEVYKSSGSSVIRANYNGTVTFDLTASSGGNAFLSTGNNHIIFETNSTERMRITSGGNLIINTSGTSAPNSGQIVNKQRSDSTTPYLNGIVNMSATTSTNLAIWYDGSAHNISATYYTGGDGGAFKPLAFMTSDTERMRITNNGNVCINRTSGLSQSYPLIIKAGSGDYIWKLFSTSEANQGDAYLSDSNGQFHIRNGSADVWLTTSAGGWSNNSDISIKENLVKIEDALDKINLINGYTYNVINDEVRQAGLIAQEVESILPEAVSTNFSKTFNKELKGLNYDSLIPLLVESIKELKAELDTLKNK